MNDETMRKILNPDNVRVISCTSQQDWLKMQPRCSMDDMSTADLEASFRAMESIPLS